MQRDASEAYSTEVASALQARKRGDGPRAFFHLERAHILGQRSTLKHVYAHWLMLVVALSQHDFREGLGQIPRLLAALLFSRVWVPLGNTGRARVGALTPMPVPADLSHLVAGSGPSPAWPLPWGRLSLACLLAFLVVALTQSLTRDADLEVLGTVSEWRSPCLTLLMQGVSLLGSGAAEAPFAFGVAGVLTWRGRKAHAAGYALSVLFGWAAYGLLKVSFHRTRPSLVEHLSDGGWYSFPSGHAMMAPIVYVLAVHLLWPSPAPSEARAPGLILAWVVAFFIAGSRVYLGVHYPSDVAAGLLAGTSSVALSMVAMSRLGRRVITA